MGRPSAYTPELADEICTRLMEGEALIAICRDGHMPSAVTVFNWLGKAKDSEEFTRFLNNYTRAREAQGDLYAESTTEIVDDGRNDWMERRSEAEKGAGINNGWVLNGEHIQRSRLRFDQRRWYASKLNPKKYGEKTTQELTGPDGGPIAITGVQITIVDPKE